jgi:hypothetical protein
MRVEITRPPRLMVEGVLQTVIISEQDGAFPHMVLQMRVNEAADPVRVTLDQCDLSTITRLAKGSTVEKLRDAVRLPLTP